jgi:hypothetical protein
VEDVTKGRGSAVRPPAAESGAGNLGIETSVSRVRVEHLKVAVEAVLSSAECSQLVGEVSDLLPKCGVLRWLTNASESRLDFNLGDVVRTEGCGL